LCVHHRCITRLGIAVGKWPENERRVRLDRLVERKLRRGDGQLRKAVAYRRTSERRGRL
jgi:hypothetical protein